MNELALLGVGLGGAAVAIVVAALMYKLSSKRGDAIQAAADARVELAQEKAANKTNLATIETLKKANETLTKKNGSLSAALDKALPRVPLDVARELVLARADAEGTDDANGGSGETSTVPDERPPTFPDPRDTDLERPE